MGFKTVAGALVATVALGCGFCCDSGNRPYHLEQIATRPDSSDLLMRCPRCSVLWELPALGAPDVILSPSSARAHYPGVLFE